MLFVWASITYTVRAKYNFRFVTKFRNDVSAENY